MCCFSLQIQVLFDEFFGTEFPFQPTDNKEEGDEEREKEKEKEGGEEEEEESEVEEKENACEGGAYHPAMHMKGKRIRVAAYLLDNEDGAEHVSVMLQLMHATGDEIDHYV